MQVSPLCALCLCVCMHGLQQRMNAGAPQLQHAVCVRVCGIWARRRLYAELGAACTWCACAGCLASALPHPWRCMHAFPSPSCPHPCPAGAVHRAHQPAHAAAHQGAQVWGRHPLWRDGARLAAGARGGLPAARPVGARSAGLRLLAWCTGQGCTRGLQPSTAPPRPLSCCFLLTTQPPTGQPGKACRQLRPEGKAPTPHPHDRHHPHAPPTLTHHPPPTPPHPLPPTPPPLWRAACTRAPTTR